MLLYLATGAKIMLIIRALAALCLPGCANAASVAFPTPPQRIVSDGTVFQVFFETTTLRMHSAASDNTVLDYGKVAIGAYVGPLASTPHRILLEPAADVGRLLLRTFV